MSRDNEIDREALLRLANHVRPALATQPYIPALTHILFTGKRAVACNDLAAISVRCEVAFDGAILPGDLLIRALGSFAGQSVLAQPGDGFVLLACGRSKVKVPTLAAGDYPFSMPDDDAPTVFLGASSVEAIKRCLFAVGDAKRPEQAGVTMEADDGLLVFYSTDNHTISRAVTTDKAKLPGGAPVILPTFLCEQVVRLAAAFKETEVDLVLYPGGVLAQVGKHAEVFHKTLVDIEPLDFPKTFARMVESEGALREASGVIPEGFDSAVERAAMVMPVPGEPQSTGTQLVPGEDNFSLHSSGTMGDADDRLRFDGVGSDAARTVDPGLLARGAKACSHMALMPRCVAFCNDDRSFVHLVSHIEKR